MILTDKSGRPAGIWVADRDGMIVFGFDENARWRVQANLGPATEAEVTIVEIGDSDDPDHDAFLALDPEHLREVSFPTTHGRIPWLAGNFTPVRAPVRLINQRDEVLWASKPTQGGERGTGSVR